MMIQYPEHERMRIAREIGRSDEIGQFLEWLRSGSGYVIAEWEEWRACESESWNYRSAWGHVEWKCLDGRIMTGADFEVDDGECFYCEGTGRFKPKHPQLMASNVSIIDLLAKYFEIDLDKIEGEKRAMLDAIKEGNREA